MSENSSGPWKETFCILKCRKKSSGPRNETFYIPQCRKILVPEARQVSLQGPDFYGMDECKMSHYGDQKTFPSWVREKATARTSCCNIHNATMPATEEPASEEPTTAETLASAWSPARV
jgi:hypothetical protein